MKLIKELAYRAFNHYISMLLISLLNYFYENQNTLDDIYSFPL